MEETIYCISECRVYSCPIHKSNVKDKRVAHLYALMAKTQECKRTCNKNNHRQELQLFNQRLKDAVNAKHTTCVQLARDTGVYKEQLRNYIKGYQVPNATTLSYICFALNVSADFLCGLRTDADLKKGTICSFKNRINELVKTYSACKIEQLACVDMENVTNYINGRNEPTLVNLYRIAKATSTSMDWLIGISDERELK